MWSPAPTRQNWMKGTGPSSRPLRLQALPDGGAAVRGVGLHGCGRQAVADGQHDALPREQVAQDGLIFFVKAAAEVRTGQVFVLAFAHGLHKGIVIFSQKRSGTRENTLSCAAAWSARKRSSEAVG